LGDSTSKGPDRRLSAPQDPGQRDPRDGEDQRGLGEGPPTDLAEREIEGRGYQYSSQGADGTRGRRDAFTYLRYGTFKSRQQ
jgi:hypothetical protein